MGGAACIVHFQAVVTFSAVPTNAADLPKFDAQIRQFFADRSDDVVLELPGEWAKVCDMLGKHTWTASDRAELWDWAERLWAGVPYS